MTLKEANIILKRHNQWRGGAEIEMENPTQLGIAIDVITIDNEQGLDGK